MTLKFFVKLNFKKKKLISISFPVTITQQQRDELDEEEDNEMTNLETIKKEINLSDENESPSANLSQFELEELVAEHKFDEEIDDKFQLPIDDEQQQQTNLLINQIEQEEQEKQLELNEEEDYDNNNNKSIEEIHSNFSIIFLFRYKFLY